MWFYLFKIITFFSSSVIKHWAAKSSHLRWVAVSAYETPVWSAFILKKIYSIVEMVVR